MPLQCYCISDQSCLSDPHFLLNKWQSTLGFCVQGQERKRVWPLWSQEWQGKALYRDKSKTENWTATVRCQFQRAKMGVEMRVQNRKYGMGGGVEAPTWNGPLIHLARETTKKVVPIQIRFCNKDPELTIHLWVCCTRHPVQLCSD